MGVNAIGAAVKLSDTSDTSEWFWRHSDPGSMCAHVGQVGPVRHIKQGKRTENVLREGDGGMDAGIARVRMREEFK